MVPLVEGYPPDETYGPEEDPESTWEDSPHSRLGTAKVKRVLPSMMSEQQDGPCYWEPSPD